MPRENLKSWTHGKGERIEAPRGDGTSRSSDEVSVMETERRGRIVELGSERKTDGLRSSGGTDQGAAKPFTIPRQWVYQAWLKVKANRGSGGVDGMSLADFEVDYKPHLYRLWNRMSSGSYMPSPVRLLEIPKKGGGLRPLGIPTIADRVGQTVVKDLLEQEIEPLFHEDSYGYRPGKSAAQALAKAREHGWSHDWVIDLDIKGFFDAIPHDLLMKAVRKHFDCRWILLYIERWLSAPLQTEDGRILARTQGVPQGSVIGPLLANLYLHYVMDLWLSRRYPDCPFERYADDALIHCKSKSQAEELLQHLRGRMKECGLELHPQKTKLVYCKDSNRRGTHEHVSLDFLGFTFKPRLARNSKRGVWFTSWLPAVSRKAMGSMNERMKGWSLLRSSGCTLQQLAKSINPVL